MTHRRTAQEVLRRAGRTFADEAGIRLADTPAPLYRLLVLATLLSSRVGSRPAVAAAAELIGSGLGTPRMMAEASWQQRVDALDRARYTRTDEQTATALGEGAERTTAEYGGDLRRLRKEAGGNPDRIRELLTGFPRIGPVGADIFCREAQDVWPELRPALDGKVTDGARRLGLPGRAADLAALVDGADLARFAAGLVRVGLDDDLADEITGG